jgi:NADH-quinone oxidoreductase subunit J
MVLFLFVLMLLNVKREDHEGEGGWGLKGTAFVLGGLLVAQVGLVLHGAGLGMAPGFEASTRSVAQELFSAKYVYVFEATSVLIVAALVGAVVLARKER